MKSDTALTVLTSIRDKHLQQVRNLNLQLAGVQRAIERESAKVEAIENAIESINGGRKGLQTVDTLTTP